MKKEEGMKLVALGFMLIKIHSIDMQRSCS